MPATTGSHPQDRPARITARTHSSRWKSHDRSCGGEPSAGNVVAPNRHRVLLQFHRRLPAAPAPNSFHRETPTPTSGKMVNKITVVGAGNVGATTAQRLAEK